MHRARVFVALSLLRVGGMLACNRAPEPNPSENKQAPAASSGPTSAAPTAPMPTPTNGPELAWTAPTAWEKSPNPGPMRKATYKIKGPDARGAEVSVSQAGGSVMDNVKRWAGQMVGSDKTLEQHEKKVGPYDVTIVEMAGEYQPGMMPNAPVVGAIPDSMFVGAIVDLRNGQSLFFKMVGSTAAVKAARPDFDAMVDSVH
jgi:hypothetical protein